VCAMVFAHETLAIRRLAVGLSRDQLAERSGVFMPRASTALALASALDIDVSDLWTVGERAA
jgi:transcriptional regulator with XRE-family HTH domain